jgi:hypothetical protein
MNKASQNARIMSMLSVSRFLTPHPSSFLLAQPPVLCVPEGLGWLIGCVCLGARLGIFCRNNCRSHVLSCVCHVLTCFCMPHALSWVREALQCLALHLIKLTAPPSLQPPPVYCVDLRSWSLGIEFLRQVPRSQKAEPDTAHHSFRRQPSNMADANIQFIEWSSETREGAEMRASKL